MRSGAQPIIVWKAVLSNMRLRLDGAGRCRAQRRVQVPGQFALFGVPV